MSVSKYHFTYMITWLPRFISPFSTSKFAVLQVMFFRFLSFTLHWSNFRSHPGPHLSHHLPPPKRQTLRPTPGVWVAVLSWAQASLRHSCRYKWDLKILAADTSSIVNILICKGCSIGVERNGPKKLRELSENPTASHVFMTKRSPDLLFNLLKGVEKIKVDP